MEEIRTEMNKGSKENCSENPRDNMPDIRSALQRDAAAAYAHPEVQPHIPRASPQPGSVRSASGRALQGLVLPQPGSLFCVTAP